MKTVFLFFLLVNLAYLYFQSGANESSTGSTLLTQPKLPADAKPLVLLRERGLSGSESKSAPVAAKKPQTKKLAVNAIKPTPVVSPPKRSQKKPPQKPLKSTAAVCFTFGPLVKRDKPDKAVVAANRLGIEVDRRQESQREPKGYWVYLPASKSYKAAKRKVAEMQKRGLKDLFIMGKGSRKNAISLGLFKSKKAAEDRFKQVKKMGLTAEFETQYRVTEQAWLDMKVAGDQTSTVAALTEMTEGYPNANLTQRKCQ